MLLTVMFGALQPAAVCPRWGLQIITIIEITMIIVVLTLLIPILQISVTNTITASIIVILMLNLLVFNIFIVIGAINSYHFVEPFS